MRLGLVVYLFVCLFVFFIFVSDFVSVRFLLLFTSCFCFLCCVFCSVFCILCLSVFVLFVLFCFCVLFFVFCFFACLSLVSEMAETAAALIKQKFTSQRESVLGDTFIFVLCVFVLVSASVYLLRYSARLSLLRFFACFFFVLLDLLVECCLRFCFISTVSEPYPPPSHPSNTSQYGNVEEESSSPGGGDDLAATPFQGIPEATAKTWASMMEGDANGGGVPRAVSVFLFDRYSESFGSAFKAAELGAEQAVARLAGRGGDVAGGFVWVDAPCQEEFVKTLGVSDTSVSKMCLFFFFFRICFCFFFFVFCVLFLAVACMLQLHLGSYSSRHNID